MRRKAKHTRPVQTGARPISTRLVQTMACLAAAAIASVILVWPAWRLDKVGQIEFLVDIGDRAAVAAIIAVSLVSAIVALSVLALLLTLPRTRNLPLLIAIEWCGLAAILFVLVMFADSVSQLNQLLADPRRLLIVVLAGGFAIGLLNAMMLDDEPRQPRIVAVAISAVASAGAVTWLLLAG